MSLNIATIIFTIEKKVSETEQQYQERVKQTKELMREI